MLGLKAGGYLVVGFLAVGAINAQTHLLWVDDESPHHAAEAPATHHQPIPHTPSEHHQPSGKWTRPAPGGIGTPYGAPGGHWSSGYHTGVDFPVATGTTVKAASSGTVIAAGWGGAYGNQVVIRHEGGIYTQYGHMSRLGVHAGQHVEAGQPIGLSGATGNATGPHLHFEVRTGPGYGSDINPLNFLRKQGVGI